MLKFSPLKNNAKLKWIKNGYSISLLSGHTCVGADKCKSQVIETSEGRRIQDGPNVEFRCFSASTELIFKKTYEQRKHNTEEFVRTANSQEAMVRLIQESLPKDSKVIRIHVAGDFRTQRMFDAWCEVARLNKEIIFYAYTKSLIFWVKRLGKIPSNLVLTASKGGKFDHLIEQYKLRYVQVVYSEYEGKKLKLPIDFDDSHAILPKYRDTNFALVVHSMGPKGSKHARSWKRQIDGKNKFHGYTSGKNFGKYYKEHNRVNATTS